MPDYAQCANVPTRIFDAIVTKMATFHELATVYGVKDLYDLLEIAKVDRYNQALTNRLSRRP